MFFGRQRPVEWIVAFLGNPGPKYENTRHNAGFMAGAAAQERFGVKMDRLRHRALTARCEIAGQGVLLMEPQTYMNLSGEAVGEAARFYKVPSEHVIVVSDEMALTPGSLRIRKSGSAGGHNGLKSIIAHLGTDQFPRIRLGIGEPEHEPVDWVLGKFTGSDAEAIADACKRAAAAIECYISEGPDRAMTKYNRKA
ncbi:MAG TPA: aminoacyl-tRNA hydrolase [Candidatus Scatomorpha merdigallinarum]|nr:aminoacyl-tRNA hydrolase [Candidatus Scatomorpha merdigallinarum]